MYNLCAIVLVHKDVLLYIEKWIFVFRNTKCIQKGWLCMDPTFCLKLLIEKGREFNLETHLLFIDYEKAFDNIQDRFYVTF